MNLAEQIIEVLKQVQRPLSAEDIAEEMAINGSALKAFFAGLTALEESAMVFKNRSGLYGLPARMNLAVGILNMSAKGFGFVVPEVRESENDTDVFIPGPMLGNAMHGDKVVARVTPSVVAGRAREGEIIRIVTRANTRIVGTFEKSAAFGFVTPDNQKLNQDIFIAKKDFNGARIGTKVVVEITKWPERHRNPEGRIVEVLGKVGAPGVDVLSVMREHDLTEGFPDDVQAAADKVPDKVCPAEYKGRLDRREFTTVTIDGDDSKDFDDAVYAEKRGKGWFLGVYIADVSHYVRENEPLDVEARSRATSVYLVDRVIPMLPEALSNGICSLNEGVERLVMACELELKADGTVADYIIAPAVIRSHRRLTYNIVNKILVDKDSRFVEDNADILPMLKALQAIRDARLKVRKKRGAIEFSLPEIKVKLDQAGHPVAIVKRTGSLSESIIEECMLIANETVAEHIDRKHLPFIYRVHENPKEEKIDGLNDLLAAFGQHIPKSKEGKIKPIDIQRVLEKSVGTPEEKIISKVALRSMQQARYSHESLGHFGLAARYYTHFTSPIRRYPDLIVHRILRETFKTGTLGAKRQEKLRALLPEWAEHSSAMERVATEAERETTEMKAIEYMAQFVGETFSGVISGVTAFGIFVELETGVEGLVHVSRMVNDYYDYDEAHYQLVGGRTGQTYRLGDEIEVVLVRADVETRELDLVIKGDGVYTLSESEPATPKVKLKERSEAKAKYPNKGKKKTQSGRKDKDMSRKGTSSNSKTKKKSSVKGRKKNSKRRNNKD